MMLAYRLVRLIENHSDALAASLLERVRSSAMRGSSPRPGARRCLHMSPRASALRSRGLSAKLRRCSPRWRRCARRSPHEECGATASWSR